MSYNLKILGEEYPRTVHGETPSQGDHIVDDNDGHLVVTGIDRRLQGWSRRGDLKEGVITVYATRRT